MQTGCFQIYTGNGKGKTTAALGLALRAVGAGLRVFIGQFIKSGDYSEIKALRKYLPGVTVRQYGRGKFIKGAPPPEDIRAAETGLADLESAVLGGKYDIVIADEANCAVTAGLFDIDRLLRMVDNRPDGVELIVTGRNAHPQLVAKADLVTDMREVKHPCQKGMMARIGIEM